MVLLNYELSCNEACIIKKFGLRSCNETWKVDLLLRLRCGHAFHYPCIAIHLLEETNSCPICHHAPQYDICNSDDSDYSRENNELNDF